MQALVFHGRRDVRLEDFPEPDRVGAREVRLKVKSSAICHTDFNEYMHGPIYITATPNKRTGRSIPLVIGHEFSGEVVEAGPEVQRLRVGDRVAVNAIDSCRNCFYCRQGLYALCDLSATIGFSRDGGFAEVAVVPSDCCYRLGPEVSYHAGALVEPLSVALHGVRQSKVGIGARVAVVGGGAVGLCTLQALRATGVREVFVIEISNGKKSLALALGANAFINPREVEPVKVIEECTEGHGVDVAFECVGSAPALQTAVAVTRGGGTICVVGVFPGPFEFDLNEVMRREKTIVTTMAYSEEFSTVIAMLKDGRLKAEPLITRTLPFSKALDEGLKQYEMVSATNVRTVVEIGT